MRFETREKSDRALSMVGIPGNRLWWSTGTFLGDEPGTHEWTCVAVGPRHVITAAHVAVGTVVGRRVGGFMDGAPEPERMVVSSTVAGGSVDLQLLELSGKPLEHWVTCRFSRVGTPMDPYRSGVLVGCGGGTRRVGAEDPNGGKPIIGAGGLGKRWGVVGTLTPHVELPGRVRVMMLWDVNGPSPAGGDSGSGIFLRVDGGWELVGICGSQGPSRIGEEGLIGDSLVNVPQWREVIEKAIATWSVQGVVPVTPVARPPASLPVTPTPVVTTPTPVPTPTPTPTPTTPTVPTLPAMPEDPARRVPMELEIERLVNLAVVREVGEAVRGLNGRAVEVEGERAKKIAEVLQMYERLLADEVGAANARILRLHRALKWLGEHIPGIAAVGEGLGQNGRVK